MIDFEVVGDLLRKNKIKSVVRMDSTPVITVVAPIRGSVEQGLVNFVFDRAGVFVGIEIIE